ncbi:DUF4006 family protein [Helicobacter felis]|uniref:Inner membrane protein n=1 Tax=Helicobacter felis (strain ATCC 49179 / CCUG 28539 / NCTC 12436 / CS1) TaxID=936155 RepID=E7AAJ6_HELFC|nr:DUF4006 family protein [Helicobacter felis]CBY83516.1 Putative inner membrane protein [Helicobacter felis ATCC 49179]
MNGLFGLNGILGCLIVVLILLGVVGFFGFQAVKIQQTEAMHPYHLNTDKIEMFEKNHQFYQVKE